MNSKYYGIKRKKQNEDLLYYYAQNSTRLKSIIPGKHRDYFKRNYSLVFTDRHTFHRRDNSLPDGHFFKLDQIVTSDLICRDDITRLQKGIRQLLKKHRAGDRFMPLPIESLEEICSRIDQMDSTLLSWYDGFQCGVFDFRGEPLEEAIDYYSVSIKNLNSSYFSVEFCLFLTEQKQNELQQIIRSNFHDSRGYAKAMLSSPENGGAFESYTICHYNDAALKADKIYEWISCLQWEFYEALKHYFPFVLHQSGAMPPRIDVLLTDIDYREKQECFWESIGIYGHEGQFIDERQKMFFGCKLSGRYDHVTTIDRLMYIVKEDGAEIGQLESVKDYVYYHIKWYAREYFRFMFLDALSHMSAKVVVKYKGELDKIKLKKNKLKRLLKLRYSFEREIDLFQRYIYDNDWEASLKSLHDEVYCESDERAKMFNKPFFISYERWGKGIVSDATMLKRRIDDLQLEFDNKGSILQHLSSYKNTSKAMVLNAIMLLLTALTLFVVIFPDCAIWIADSIQNLIAYIGHLISIILTHILQVY